MPPRPYARPAAESSSAASERRGGSRPAGEIKSGKLDPLPVRLKRLGLVSDWDFVLHLPLRYEDETRIDPIGLLRAGETAQIQGEVVRSSTISTARGPQLVAELADQTGRVTLRFIHYYPTTRSLLTIGTTLRAFGEPRPAYSGGLELIHPKLKKPVAGEDALPSSLTPVYSLGEGIQQTWLRKRINRALLDLMGMDDPLPAEVAAALQLPGLKASLEYLHHPPADAPHEPLMNRTDPHWQRLKFDELLAQQITLKQLRAAVGQESAPALTDSAAKLTTAFLNALPFALTRAQTRVWDEVAHDLAEPRPMHRLVQGDVGCGKTVIAAMAALRAIEAGRQAALMAPTEILADQHLEKIARWLEPLGVKIVRLTGRLKASEKAAALAAAASGEAQLVIGTHALIQEGVAFKALGLAIVDEQHRFGVEQRLALTRLMPDGRRPHLLMLSATPIPRTLAMSYFADIDVSVIDELPPGRTPVATKLVRLDRRDAVLAVVNDTVSKGRQVYWVCPLIEESEMLDLTPASRCAEELAARLPHVRVGLLHGAMSAAEKEAVMSDFAAGRIELLVATTVIEVGVDVPNATLMSIEHAERFGLAQLHQLRGRVGRGGGAAACVLLFDGNLSETGKERLKIIRESNDGFEIARRDLELRGPGEFLGEQQSGMPMLQFADLDSDAELVETASRTADLMLKQYPEQAARHAARWFSAKAELLKA